MNRREDNEKLDALLNSAGQQAIREAVNAMPEEQLSLAWRSDLNERLRQVRPTSKWRVTINATWKPAVMFALGGCLVMALMLRTTPLSSPKGSDNVEASLVAAFDDSANSEEVAGPGLGMHEVGDTTQASDSSSDWTDSDLTNL